MAKTEALQPQPGSDWIVGGGEMGRLIRALDWTKSPLGPIASWSQSLRTTVNLCLASDLPICIIWGPQLVQLYNDGYRVICGEKHPLSMGQNFAECWREAWPVIGAAHDSALAGDTAFLEDQQIFLERHGYVEETFFTFSFSPIRDETGRLAGLFHPVIETTAKILGERRTCTLRDLTADVNKSKTVEEAFTNSTTSLARHPLDLPFLLIYQPTAPEEASLVSAAGLVPGEAGAPQTLSLRSPAGSDWPIADVMRTGRPTLLDDVGTRIGAFQAGPFAEPITAAMVLPILKPGAEGPVGVAVLGISPRLRSNEIYAGFHNLLCGTIATAVANADAYDAERKRAEALARIDRAKTEFFSNVSHEFRTPLTLMLAPLEDALAGAGLPTHERGLIDVAHRNSLRLLKLVNLLLDFSRIEAGRTEASYEPVDLAELTAMLASNFRSLCERAGLRLVVDCSPLPEAVYVDRGMWEKIVLNLVSNAFKFTFEGEVTIAMRADGDKAVLTVRDTGVGIPEAELPRMFERFHRVENQRGRSFEGSGIGLSLVQELVSLHAGTIAVASSVGVGSEFTVAIPFGTDHLLAAHVQSNGATASTAVRASAYVEEASRWLPGNGSGDVSTSPIGIDPSDADPTASTTQRPRVLLADDNADMRDYIRRLLGAQHAVEVVADGEAALTAARLRRPDLIITDVMMPRLDGIGLVRAIRSDDALSDLPIIMLSARAGEEASAEGLQAGADDYLVKPFSARELIVRVNASLAIARLRRENAEALRESDQRQAFLLCLSDALRAETHADAITNRALRMLLEQMRLDRCYNGIYRLAEDMAEVPHQVHDDRLPPMPAQLCFSDFPEAIRIAFDRTLVIDDVAEMEGLSDSDRASFEGLGLSALIVATLREGGDNPLWAIGAASTHPRSWTQGEISLVEEVAERTWTAVERARAEVALHESEERFRNVADHAPMMMWVTDDEARCTYLNRAWYAFTGQTQDLAEGFGWLQAVHPDDQGWSAETFFAANAKREAFRLEYRLRRADGVYRWAIDAASPRFGPGGAFLGYIGSVIDIHERKAAEELLERLNDTLEQKVAERTTELEAAHGALRQSQKMEAMGQLTGGVAHDFNNLLTPVMMGLEMLRRSHDDARSQKLIGGALQSAERAKTLIQRLLSFARRQALEPIPLDAAALLTNLRDLIDRSLGPTVDVIVNVDNDLPAALIDPNQLELAILNLSVNARDAMPDGGILTIAVSSEYLADGFNRDLAPGRYVRFSISDTGCGMDSETLARSIEPFFSTKEVGQGTGLGLAMVHGLAAQSGGVFRLKSDPGVGTKASLWVPATDRAAVAAALPLPDAPTARRSATVLLVDDEELVRGSTAEGLRTLGYAVVEAASAAKALDHVVGGLRPDLVVTDHMMPGMTGAQLVAELRGIAPSLPVLMITGYASMTPGQTEGLEVLAKPFGQTELASRVESLLQSVTAPPGSTHLSL